MSNCRPSYDEISKLDVTVLALSTDSRFSHKIWDEEELSNIVPGGLPFDLVSDAVGKIGEVYGVYDEEAEVDIHGRFLSDPDGIIQAMEIMTPPVGRNFAELVRQVMAFQHVRATNEATRASRKPGDKTLRPSSELVGKVWKEWQVKE